MSATSNNTESNGNPVLTISGMLLLLSGFIIFMGIISGEVLYTLPFNTRNSYISELAAALPPNVTPRLSAIIFNLTMILSGTMIIVAGFLLQLNSGKLLVCIPIILFGTGFLGVAIFPGNIAPWHGVFALFVFLAGGMAAITSYKLVKSPLKYIFIFFGIIALTFLFLQKLFIPLLGVGGTERWLLYPEVFWVFAFGAYLIGTTKVNQQKT